MKPDAIYIGVTVAKDAGLIAKQSRQFGFKGYIVMSVAADAKEFFEASGIDTDNVYVSSSMLDTSGTKGKVFVDTYKQRYMVEPDGFAANGYDALRLITQGISACQKQDGLLNECIKDHLYSVKNYEGAGGNITFDLNGDVSKKVIIKKAVHGTFVPAI